MLKKLPIWGEKVSSRAINFSWPSQKILDKLEPDAFLKSLQFETAESFVAISRVHCILSNGLKSPIFESKKLEFSSDSATVEFHQSRPVSAVIGIEDNDGSLMEIKFLDSVMKAIGSYNPYQERGKATMHRLAANEHLIGVYGVSNRKEWFTSFGFLVKAKQPSQSQ